MKRWMVSAGLVAALCVCGASYAVPPAYCGKLGNPEEPALRPWKGMYQGVRALLNRQHEAFREGNAKLPVVGSVEVFRGGRRGVLDCVEITGRSVAGAVPPRGDEFKKQGKLNTSIESNEDGAFLVDFVSCGVVFFPVLLAVDRHAEKYEMKVVERQAKPEQWRAQRKEEAAKRAAAMTDGERVAQAQEAYLGKRAGEDRSPKKKHDPYKGNLLKLAR